MPQRSIFRQPGARHFQLVHRSQRDPLIHDPDASQHVLKAIVRGNDKRGKSRADLEAILAPEVIEHDVHANVGEAALYGIYFDDTEYDYMQHLRTVGTEEEGVESTLIEAPQSTKNSSKGKVKSNIDISLSSQDLPAEVLPSKMELPRDFEAHESVPSSISGLQPDMDPHLRQALEALEDDAFVDDNVQDDFFAELVHDGERDETEGAEYEFYEDGPPLSVNNEDEDGSWEARFARFKKEKENAHAPPPSDSDGDIYSDGGDTVGNLPALPVVGGKRRRKGASDASGYSMSSSSLYRTKALLTLDERFDQLMAKEYASDEDALDSDESETVSTNSSSASSSAPDLVTTREDYAEMVDEFLDKYELLGRKLKPVLAGESGTDKLETLRHALRQDEMVKVVAMGADDKGELDDDELFRAYDANEKEDRWDCETILTTYSNLENHPRVIRARTSRLVPNIKLDSRTGLPNVANKDRIKDQVPADERVRRIVKQTIGRPRNESKGDKKARKRAAKAERQARRADKKAMKEQFNSEMKHQVQGLPNGLSLSKIRKL